MQTFNEFVDNKQRESKKQLNLIKKMLEAKGMQARDHLKEDDPYVYVQNTGSKLSFDGVRIYKVGDTIAYRVQREEKTHPYGQAYEINVEEMFRDFMSDKDSDQEKAGKRVIETVACELKEFFEKSANAENALKQSMFDRGGDPLDRTVISTNGTDYANTVTSTGTNYGGGV